MTLKTLKDLRKWEPDLYGSPEEKNLGRYDAEELRQEAIKWIKEIDNFKKSSEDLQWEELTGKTIEYSKDSITGLKNWIKHFFNITDEELK